MGHLVRLWRRAAGDSEFESLMRPQIEPLYRLAYRFTGSAHDAEELVQDVLVKLYPRTRELRSVERLRPWLARVLYRHFVDWRRAMARTPSQDPFELDSLRADESEPGPADGAEQALQARRLSRALAALSAEHRAVLALHDVEGYTLPELSGMLELPIGTLKSRLHRARAALRAALDMEPFEAPARVTG